MCQRHTMEYNKYLNELYENEWLQARENCGYVNINKEGYLDRNACMVDKENYDPPIKRKKINFRNPKLAINLPFLEKNKTMKFENNSNIYKPNIELNNKL